MLEVRHIGRREAQMGEAIANGLNYEQIGDIFYLKENTVKTHVQRLYSALGITGIGGARKRATAMLITGGLFRSSDEKVAHKPYVCTMKDLYNSWIKIKDSGRGLPRSRANFIQPSRGTATTQDAELSTDMLTYLSYSTWGLTVEEMTKIHPSCDDLDAAYEDTKRVLRRACIELDAFDVPQAITHAHFWGGLEIDPRVLDASLNEPPDPISFERPVVIPAVRFAHRLRPAA
jgi:hypothetical protein